MTEDYVTIRRVVRDSQYLARGITHESTVCSVVDIMTRVPHFILPVSRVPHLDPDAVTRAARERISGCTCTAENLMRGASWIVYSISSDVHRDLCRSGRQGGVIAEDPMLSLALLASAIGDIGKRLCLDALEAAPKSPRDVAQFLASRTEWFSTVPARVFEGLSAYDLSRLPGLVAEIDPALVATVVQSKTTGDLPWIVVGRDESQLSLLSLVLGCKKRSGATEAET